jgi:hypothetical protein
MHFHQFERLQIQLTKNTYFLKEKMIASDSITSITTTSFKPTFVWRFSLSPRCIVQILPLHRLSQLLK